MATNDWTQARKRYQQLLDQYPDLDPGLQLAAKAKAGVTKATRSIEFANVTELLQPLYSGAEPDYCAKPAPYSGATPYRRGGRNRALLFGNSEDTSKFPAGWRTYNVGNAVLVICAGDSDYGTAVQTCDYESKLSVYGYEAVTFHKIAIPIRAYELRTGRLVADTKVQISGSSCPATLEYTTYLTFDSGPPSDVYVTPHASNVRAAFDSLINP
jgi:hypothetical protein